MKNVTSVSSTLGSKNEHMNIERSQSQEQSVMLELKSKMTYTKDKIELRAGTQIEPCK